MSREIYGSATEPFLVQQKQEATTIQGWRGTVEYQSGFLSVEFWHVFWLDVQCSVAKFDMPWSQRRELHVLFCCFQSTI